MNSIQNKELTFHNTNFSYMEMAGQIWLTAAEVGEALGYSDDKAIHRLYRKHADEFTVNMTGVVKVTTPGGVQDSRVFSLRGAHLMGMFSRTTVAKEFRRWVLDILDREVAQGNVNPIFNYGMDFFDKYRWIVGDKALNAPWFYSPEMLTTNGDYPNPCGRLLADMKNAGYSVEAAIFQLKALQHHLCLCLRKIDRVQQAVTH
ncbi:BRO-N domain-containing protein [Hafnia paralvei]|nr:Bro-N domain-containing protein [Hafnia paralvei]MCE9949229.1 Bro-N domain-containing protein [Hafnia paralvei]